MFKNLSDQDVVAGKHCAVSLTRLRGPDGPPTIRCLYLGPGNAEWERMTLESSVEDMRTAELDKETKTEAELEARALRKVRERVVACGDLKLEGFYHDDGRPATDADAAEVINALPEFELLRVITAARDPRNYQGVVSFDPATKAYKELAEK